MEEFHVAMSIAQNPEGEFLSLVKDEDYTDQERYENNRNETAGGSIEPGETPVEAAIRELDEETGLEGEYVGPEDYPADEWKFLSIREQDDRKIVFYPVPLEVDDTEVELSEEHSGYNWFTEDEFERELPDHNYEGLKTVIDSI